MRNEPFAPTLARAPRMLSQTAEHALRAVLYLGHHAEDGLISAGRLAEALGTPPNYTSKILRRLAHRGILRSARGPRGGFGLRVRPAAVSLARLVDAIDEARDAPSICLIGDRPCDPAAPCPAHRAWTDVQARMNALMEETTLDQLLEGGTAPSTPWRTRHTLQSWSIR